MVVYVLRSSDDRVDRVADALSGNAGAPIHDDADVPAAACLHEIATHADGDLGVPPVDWGDAVNSASGGGSSGAAGAAAAT
ncbi:hypothetical protein PM035_08570 [Halorubrum ezzemoulense]|uniref:hypothetical protein n=1 Tax=Halorubrum ezzemoulense TaxID=337243 RepID=UPI00232DDC12|nr:hypothetical protein [Halorubrum ezzemoulense]MDB2261620.1 hypothetical protein [Halorubrum ezzemoulense]MDB2267751.1 hypothetical protein [Halorubrum ezzemoulense]